MREVYSVNCIMCKVSGVSGVWVEEASPGAIQGVMRDGLAEVIGVSCKLLLSDGVDADPDQSLSMGRVSSNGSTPGLVGKIAADPIVTSMREGKSGYLVLRCFSISNS